MSIQQEVLLPASPSAVYSALVESEAFSAFTGGQAAHIDAKDGGMISLFGGKILGRNVELLPNERIVQAWRAGNWAEGHFSLVRFDLVKNGDATSLRLTHANYPAGEDQHLEAGWHKMYWEPLKTYLTKDGV